ncbi:PHP domain-containing protein [Maridesulfovibrio ferrireducens]|uniref:PHP domain-containing protein n=1 Tax=Maridesulfovibrio ferrireducens TaxID=246191 RepID=UPI001A2353D1|nr:PHP domain-containing protein [Maridesulfovibrio ferrireducens]MBI9111267.1 PHP domain-containing protein [Maridesulfovibrio ferrireducens]
MPGIDLHTHSTASDGTLTPVELVLAAKEEGLVAIALTDHDTIAGLPEAVRAGEKHGVEVIPGCELSVHSDVGVLHIVGLWVDPYSSILQNKFESIRKKRGVRNDEIIKKLQNLGLNITMDEVREKAAGTVGRPHIASVLLDKNYVKSFDDAFNRYIGKKGKAYISRESLAPEEAINLLKATNATSILAHPALLSTNETVLNEQVKELKRLGLDGIEIYCSSHTTEMIGICKKIARKYNLLASGGSDFHGSVKPEIKLGRGTGKLFIHHSVLDDLKALRQSKGLEI